MYEIKCCEGREPRILVTKEFVEKNKLAINVGEAKRLLASNSVFGFGLEVAICFLPWEHTKDAYTDEYVRSVDAGEVERPRVMTDEMEAAQDFLDYMVFAWMKADDERGISASRSIEKLSAWMRVLSRPDVADVLEDDLNFPMYGKPALRKACEMLDIPCPDYIR